MVRQEINQLNKRLDAIDQHCREFTRLANEKSALDQNLQNLKLLESADQQSQQERV